MSSSGTARTIAKNLPKNTTRKSKEEREANAREEDEKQRRRIEAARADDAHEAAARRAQYGAPTHAGERSNAWQKNVSHRGSSRGRGTRGGFIGMRDLDSRRRAIALASAERQSEVGRTTQQTLQGTKSETKSPTSKRKTVPRKNRDLDVEMVDEATVKSEPEEPPDPFDHDDLTRGPRKNIEHINLVSSEESEEEQTQEAVQGEANEPSTAKQGRRRGPDMFPIRLTRREHVDRVAGINTEASSSVVTEARGSAPGDRVRDAAPDAFIATNWKSQESDLEIVDGTRRWRGVYDDEEEENDERIPSSLTVKKEPRSPKLKRSVPKAGKNDNQNIASGPPEPIGIEDIVPSEKNKEETRVDVKQKAKNRTASDHRRVKAHSTLTKEDEREEDLYQQELRILREELGQKGASTGSNLSWNETQDNKADNIYLFQLPPVVPNLLDPADEVKLERGQERDKIHSIEGATRHASRGISKMETEVYTPKDGVECDLINPKIAPGKVGKLKVHKSGRVTLSWGGTSMEVKLGTQVSFLQTAVLVNRKNNDRGQATSLGNVRGRFVVCPDWNQILE